MQGMLSPYIDGRLSPLEREKIESHVEGCEACRWELESLEATVNLLQRVAMVSPLRSFALPEVAPKPHPATLRRPVAFGALRVATAVAVLVLAFLFLGDALHLFGAGLIGERLAQQVTPMPGEVLDMGGAPPEGEGYAWPLRQLELAMVGVVVALGGATAILWQKRRKGAEKPQKLTQGGKES